MTVEGAKRILLPSTNDFKALTLAFGTIQIIANRCRDTVFKGMMLFSFTFQ